MAGGPRGLHPVSCLWIETRDRLSSRGGQSSKSPLPVRRTLAQLGIAPATFYRWYDQYSSGGPEALNDRSPRPDHVLNRIPGTVRDNVIQLALPESALSPRELAVRFKDTKSYFVSELRYIPSTEGAGPDRRLGLHRNQIVEDHYVASPP